MSGRKQVRAVVLAALLVLSSFSMVGVGAATPSTGNDSTGDATETTFHVSQGQNCYPVTALGDGNETVENFYDYRNPETEPSDSNYASHGTVHLQSNQESKLFLYNGTNGYSLVLLHDKFPKNGGDGSNASTVTFTMSGMPEDGSWVVKDDSYDNGNQDDNWNTSTSTHEIDWMWAPDRNDGGAFLGMEGAEITIDPGFNGEANQWGDWDYSNNPNDRITEWKLIDGDRSETKLDMSQSITVAQGECSDDGEPNTDPTADFTVSNETVANDETVEFDASGSSDEDGTIESYEWDFGDGNSESGVTTEHSYGESGEYDVTLTVTDDDGNTATATTTVTVDDAKDEGIEYINSSTVEVIGEFEEVTVHEEWYHNDGADARAFTLTNVSGTTTITADAEGVNGSAIVDVSAFKNLNDAEPDYYKENPFDYGEEIKPRSVEVSVGSVTPVDEDTYDVTFEYTNPNDEELRVRDSLFAAGNVDSEPPKLLEAGEHSFEATWTPAGNDERVTWEVNQSNFGLGTVTATGPTPEEIESPNARIEAPDWAHQNSGADFDGSNSTDEGEIVSYEWEFSDGGNATGEEVNYIYNETGEHTATLTVTDDDGYTDSKTVPITIVKEDAAAPDASVTASPKTVETGETVSFDGSNSSDESGISKYQWDFDGDGEFDRTTDEATTTYAFSESGEYEVKLAVHDDGDYKLSDSDTVNVTVTESSSEPPTDGAPTAKLSLSTQTADFYDKVGFNASAATDDDGDVVEYRWDLDGDGEIDRKTSDKTSGKNSQPHTIWHKVYSVYDEPGTYTASVTVVDDDGNTDTATKKLTIERNDNKAPNATLDVPDEVTVGEEFTVKATDFTEDQNNLKHICWTFGEEHGEADGATATYKYEETGKKTIKLHLKDKAGNSKTLETTVTVTKADDGGDGDDGDDGDDDDSNDPPKNDPIDDDPNDGNKGGGIPTADPPADDSDDDTPKKAAFGDAGDNYGEIVLQSDATDAVVEVFESVPNDARQATPALDGFEALSYVTVSGAEDINATFTVSKDRLESADATPEAVTLFRFDDGSWNAVETEQLNETADAYEFGASTTNGTYAIGIGVPSTAVEDLRVAADRVAPGDSVTVTAIVENDGHASGTQDVELTVDGETVATKSVSVSAGSTEEVEFTRSFDSPGVYAVSAGDANAEIVVEGIETTTTEETTTDMGTTTATETGDTNGGNVPGFGVGAALAALAAAALLARRKA